MIFGRLRSSGKQYFDHSSENILHLLEYFFWPFYILQKCSWQQSGKTGFSHLRVPVTHGDRSGRQTPKMELTEDDGSACFQRIARFSVWSPFRQYHFSSMKSFYKSGNLEGAPIFWSIQRLGIWSHFLGFIFLYEWILKHPVLARTIPSSKKFKTSFLKFFILFMFFSKYILYSWFSL